MLRLPGRERARLAGVVDVPGLAADEIDEQLCEWITEAYWSAHDGSAS